MIVRRDKPSSAAWLLRRLLLAGVCCAGLTRTVPAADVVRIGSKNFTEQEILGELVAQLIERHTGLRVERKFGLGGTGVCQAALVVGELDIYVEYTGTALLNVLKADPPSDRDEVFRTVAKAYREQFDLQWLPPMGFNNTYAITVRAGHADEHGWRTIDDLADVANGLSAGFTAEFMERPDGYPGLRRAYGLEFRRTADLDPGLMYKALAEGQVDVICAFATDGRLAAYNLRVLADDRGFFPPYDAAPVVRNELLEQHPEVRDALVALAGTINDATMRRMNYAVDELRQSPVAIAREWIESRSVGLGAAGSEVEAPQAKEYPGFWAIAVLRRAELGRKTLEHLALTAIAMLIAVLVGVPTGIAIHRCRSAVPPVLAVTEIVQTIPSLAMLAFLFAIYRMLGTAPAVTALVLYALLPIVLNTFTGLKELSPEIIEAADGIGMSSRQRLWMVELPLAMPVIVAGIRTATVWTVGIATLSTYIGAGGLGDFISRGLARDDARLTLLGAVPAAAMAVVLSLAIRVVERLLRQR
ncbi:MAG: glycine betaine ABC transporter substrate-binding protein [Planctomycetota bacterium]|jgi:osmoprotectant transport system permease protein